MQVIPLLGPKAAGRIALVDDEDYELVSNYKWYVHEKIREKIRTQGPYAQARIYLPDGRQTSLRMHKVITGWPMTDHIDGNGLNNQRHNLRRANQSQQSINRRSFLGSSSRFKGVSLKKNGRWIAYIDLNHRRTNLGTFGDEIEAAIAYDNAARQLHGEFARLNFPDGQT